MKIESTARLSRLLRGGPFRKKDRQGNCYVIDRDNTQTHKHAITNCNKCYDAVSVRVLQEADGKTEYKRLTRR